MFNLQLFGPQSMSMNFFSVISQASNSVVANKAYGIFFMEQTVNFSKVTSYQSSQQFKVNKATWYFAFPKKKKGTQCIHGVEKQGTK